MFLVDLKCDKCEYTWEAMLNDYEDVNGTCPSCDSDDVYRLLGGVITKLNDPQTRNEALKKRADDHSKKTHRDNVARVKEQYRKKGLAI